MGARQFGARVSRLEDPALLAGVGRFVDDVKLPGALHACFVRSPHAHARIRAIDTAAALALPGVHAVMTADDLPEPMRSERIPNLMGNPAIKIMRTQHALAREEVCYVGEAVAVVIADSRYIAEDAAALVEVDYDVLPAVSDCRDAVKPDAPRAHSDIDDNVAAFVRMEYGDVDAAFANAPHVFEERMWLHRGGGMALETRGVTASYDPASDMLTVWSSTQTPHIGRRMIADLLGRNLEAVAHDRARRRRRLRPQGAVLCRGGGDSGGGASARPPGAVVRGPARALPLRHPGARPALRHGDRSRSRRQDHGRARRDAARHRRLHAVGHHHALYRGDDDPRALRGPELSARMHGGDHQQGADHAGARRRPAAGGVRHGADDGSRRARALARPRRGAPAQFHPARADALRGGPDLPRRHAARLSRRRLSARPGGGARARRLRGLPANARRRRAAEGRLYRHRHRQLRGGHRARSVRGRHHPGAAERQGGGRDRRHQPGTGPAHRAVADRRRPGRLPHRGHRDDHGRHRGDLARASAPSRAARR